MPGALEAAARLEAVARLSPTWSAFAAAEAALSPLGPEWRAWLGARAQW